PGIACILSNPIACYTHALFTPGLVLADSDREPALSGADKRIAHEPLNRSDDTFHFRLVFLDNIKERFRTFAGIVSENCVHDIPPTFSCKSELRRSNLALQATSWVEEFHT